MLIRISKLFHFKVDRSVALLKSLDGEKQRWEAGSETFKSQMSTIIGDVLLSSNKFITYSMMEYSLQCMFKNMWQSVVYWIFFQWYVIFS
jgi:dynein heavy chain 1